LFKRIKEENNFVQVKGISQLAREKESIMNSNERTHYIMGGEPAKQPGRSVVSPKSDQSMFGEEVLEENYTEQEKLKSKYSSFNRENNLTTLSFSKTENKLKF